jgi:isopentenyl-diphosphate delta-isomerase
LSFPQIYGTNFADLSSLFTVDYVFIIKADVTLEPSPNEVQAVRYVERKELEELLANAAADGTKITPWFQLIVEKFLYGWWDQIDNLGPLRDDDIHHLV